MTAKPSHMPLKRILLAEDDESMRGFLERALVKAGYEVRAFADGLAAFERLKEESFTLLLTDIVMPQMDGIELQLELVVVDEQDRGHGVASSRGSTSLTNVSTSIGLRR